MRVVSGECRWALLENDEGAVSRLARDSGIDPIIARLLLNRGLRDPEDVRRYMSPSLADLHDPSLLPDYEVGVNRIAAAVCSGELISIHGDYDADGVSSTALLARTLRALKANCEFSVPHRANDGYDIKPQAVERAAKRGAKVIITCDCGVTAFAAVDRARELGIDVIITDHHEPEAELPNALAVIDPKRGDSRYPFRDLAGVGVAFKVAQGVSKALGCPDDSFVKRFLDLAAIGTVADVVPLLDENRIIVSKGLEAVAASGKAGIQALLQSAGLSGKALSAYSLGFVIGPRINAVGRMADAEAAVRLLYTQDQGEATKIALELENHNRARKEAQEVVVNQALEKLAEKDLDSLRAIVLARKGWNKGVVGIAAGRLTEMFNRPTVILSVDSHGTLAVGSARSCGGINLIECLRLCGDLLEDFGGHAMAAGVGVRLENLVKFEEMLNAVVSQIAPEVEAVPTIEIEAFLDPSAVSLNLARMVAKLDPFGEGNPEPVFASRGLRAVDVRAVGNGSHLKLQLADPAGVCSLGCIGFGMGELADTITNEQPIDVCYNLRINAFNGSESADLNIIDIRQSAGSELA